MSDFNLYDNYKSGFYTLHNKKHKYKVLLSKRASKRTILAYKLKYEK